MLLSGFRKLTILLSLCCCNWIVDLPAQADGQAKTEQRIKSPNPVNEQKARAQIERAFDANYQKIRASKKAADKVEFGKLLIEHARDPKNDVALRYVCLKESRKMMEQGGSAAGAMSAIDLMGELFDIVPLTLKVDSLAAVTAKSLDDFKSLASLALNVADQLERLHKYELLVKSSEVAFDAANRSKDKQLIKAATELKQIAPTQKLEFEAYQKAKRTLSKSPDDTEANLIVGRFLCLVEGDWKAGAPLIAKSGDRTLKRLAQREADCPDNLEEVIKLAEDWQSTSQSQSGSFKQRMLRESAYWYFIGSLEAIGIQKALCEKMAAQDPKFSPRKPAHPGLLQTVYEGTDFNMQRLVRIRPNVFEDFGNGAAIPDLNSDRFSIRWVGMLKVEETQTYTIGYYHDDGGRLWIDEVNIIDNFGPAGHEHRDVKLTAGLHPVRVEYCERGGVAGVYLTWKVSGSDKDHQIIPPSAFICDPNVARARAH